MARCSRHEESRVTIKQGLIDSDFDIVVGDFTATSGQLYPFYDLVLFEAVDEHPFSFEAAYIFCFNFCNPQIPDCFGFDQFLEAAY